MTSPFVLRLGDADSTQASRVGGKAAALSALLHAGFPVPPGVCVTVDAFLFALAEFKAPIDAVLRRQAPLSPSSAQAAADAITRLLADLAVPPAVAAPLRLSLPDIGVDFTVDAPPLAIRSSAVDEDGLDASFAGCYRSVIGARGEDAVHRALAACWRSFYGANALLARAARRDGAAYGDAPGGMAVVIQPVIEAECAGVCFSVDPVRQRRDQVVVNAAWGLGAGVVDGSVATDTARINRTDLSIAERQIAVKEEQIILDPGPGQVLRRAAVPPERQRAACLPDTWLSRVAQFGMAAELLFEHPQELEWAAAANTVWVLQSRPITGLPPRLARAKPFPVAWEDDEGQRSAWQRRGRGQRDDVLFPLEQDEIIQLESVRTEWCRLLGIERNEQMKIVNGRAYARPIPMNWSAAERRIRRAAHEDLLARLQGQGLTIWDHWGPEIVRATERIRAFNAETAEDHALADHLAEVLAVRRRHFMLHPAFSLQPPASYFDAYAAVTGTDPADARTAAYRLLDAGETPLSRRIELLYDLACTARRDAEVAALIADPAPDALARLAGLPQGRVLLEQIEHFLAEYGEHTGHGWGSEALLRQPTWRERPETALAFLGPFLDPQVEPPAAARRRAQQALEAEVEALCAACQDPAIAQEFRRQWDYARMVHAVLEIHNHYIDQISTGQLRHAVMAAGRRLVSRGALTAADEVLWLSFGEITGALRGAPDRASRPLVDLISARKQQHAEWLSLEAPPVLGVPEARLPERPPLGDDVSAVGREERGVLVGLGASLGRRRGRARVVVDAGSLPKVERGDILVAWNVGPAWLPLFPYLGGLILEGGSIGQHAAATAREYGLPAVVNVKRAVVRIAERAWVTVDGTTGVVVLS